MVYVGASQTDYHVEEDAMKGLYRIVFLTPEKLNSPGFLGKLSQLHASDRIQLLAVGELSCVVASKQIEL